MSALRSLRTRLLVAASATLLSACASYEDRSAAVANSLEAGQYAAAASAAKAGLDDAPDRDRLLWELEYAACERAAGNWKVSLDAFERAEDGLRKWDEAPDLLVGSETSATLVNLTALPYRGTGYDRIMAATYRAMNELALGRTDRARVELNRTLLRQDEAAAFARRQVEAARSEAANAGKQGDKGVDASRSANAPETQARLSALYGDLKTYRIYGDYVNPFSLWLHGVFFLATAEGGSDVERAHKSLERLHAIVPGCAAATADYELARRLRDGEPLPPVVWVVHESGMAPHKTEERVDIPLFIVSDTVPYAGIALPKLVFHGGATPSLAVESAGRVVARTESLASMDAVIATDFDNEKGVIVTRSIVTAGLKAATQYVLNAAARKVAEERQDAAGFLIYLGTYATTGIATYATTKADLRTWRSLPKDFGVTRLPIPPDRRLRLVGSTPAQSADITLPAGSAFIVLAKSTAAGTPLIVSVTPLKP